MKTDQTVVVIGGGAAGFFAAITCAEANPNTKVILLERGKSVLGKVKVSGGGRCNVTHACFVPKDLIKFYPRGAKELLGPFHKFCSGDTIDWFDKRGVALKIEEDGRMFPTTDSSQTIVDCLWQSAKKAGVEVRTLHRVEDFLPPTETHQQWKVIISKSDPIFADKLMIATGSNPAIWKRIEALGLEIVPPVPSLFTFNIKDDRIEGLPGISVPNAEVQIVGEKLKTTGPLLITHWGMSGPGILKLSAWGARELFQKNYQFDIKVNWLYPYHQGEILETLKDFKTDNPKRQILAKPLFDLPARLWKKLVEHSGISNEQQWANLSKKGLNKLVENLTGATFRVNGKSTFKEEFVTAGGIALAQIDFKNFSSKTYPSLYFAGEVLDIDAVTGGFNFQAAWTGGKLAGLGLAER